MITILTGGSGGAKFVQGMVKVVDPREVTVIVNTGDDLRWWGLRVSPDIDSVVYALAGLLSKDRGWGVEGDTFQCLARMRNFGAPAWFQLGDRDLATHLRRTELLRNGATLSEATTQIATALGVPSRILPMSDDRVETRVVTDSGELSFQEYFVRERWQPAVNGVYFCGAGNAAPARDVLEAIKGASAVFLAPSNPITSIGPILAVPGIREALQRTEAEVVAISPIIGEHAVSGPAVELMKSAKLPASCAGVAQAYQDFLDVLVIDEADAQRAAEVESLGVRACVAATLMDSDNRKPALAAAALAAAKKRQSRGRHDPRTGKKPERRKTTAGFDADPAATHRVGARDDQGRVPCAVGGAGASARGAGDGRRVRGPVGTAVRLRDHPRRREPGRD
jgi:LPPG:FO 2-phospho-L-lactate transferase